MVNTSDLKSAAEMLAGSTPVPGTTAIVGPFEIDIIYSTVVPKNEI